MLWSLEIYYTKYNSKLSALTVDPFSPIKCMWLFLLPWNCRSPSELAKRGPNVKILQKHYLPNWPFVEGSSLSFLFAWLDLKILLDFAKFLLLLSCQSSTLVNHLYRVSKLSRPLLLVKSMWWFVCCTLLCPVLWNE